MEGEVIISCSKDDSIYVWEPQSLTVLANFVDNSSAYKQSVAYTSNMLVAAQGHKTLMHYYVFGKEGPDKKSGVLEEITCLSCTDWLVLGGSVHGTLFLWDISSGEVLKTWKPHHSKINLVILDDWIVSASEDATIKVYKTSSIIQGSLSAFKEIAINTLPITGIKKLGKLFFTCSKDKSFNVFENWELKTQKFFHCSLNCLESMESSLEVFLGCEDGSLLQAYSGQSWEVDEKPISNVKLTLSEQYLIVSAQKVYVMSPVTGQKLKTFVLHTSEVFCLLCIPRPSDFATGALGHHSTKPLKKVVESEPNVVSFSFVRAEEEKTNDPQVVLMPSNSEELEKLRQANSILYRLWVEHCS
jgi:hypothetical protein